MDKSTRAALALAHIMGEQERLRHNHRPATTREEKRAAREAERKRMKNTRTKPKPLRG